MALLGIIERTQISGRDAENVVIIKNILKKPFITNIVDKKEKEAK